MKEFGKGPKFEHPKFVLRNQVIINLLRKYVYSYINFTAQEYNLMTWTDQRQNCNFKVHILLFLAQISRINVVRKIVFLFNLIQDWCIYCFLNSVLRKRCFLDVGNATPWKPSLCFQDDFGEICAFVWFW